MNFKDWLSEAVLWDFLNGSLRGTFPCVRDLVEANLPPCPQCGAPMKVRTARTGFNAGGEFLGCSQYPNCKATRPLPGPTPAQPQQQPSRQQVPSVNRPQPAQSNQPQGQKTWIYAYVKKPNPLFPERAELALSKRPDGNWDAFVVNTNDPALKKIRTLTPQQVTAGFIESHRDQKKQPYRTIRPSMKELADDVYASDPEWSQYGLTMVDSGEIAGAQPLQQAKPNVAKSHLIPNEMMSEEQQAIDTRFEQAMKEPGASHLMINALAGSGKTTMLKHLAHKYSQGQKWLYLVFGTKNKVEAQEKFPRNVKVRTSNAFAGEVLGSRDNTGRMPKTERIVQAMGNSRGGDEDDDPSRTEKIRLLADGPEFTQLMYKLGIPTVVMNPGQYGRIGKTLASLVRSLSYTFKEEVLKLVGIAKSYAVDPRHQDGLGERLQFLLQDYDFDTDMSEIKQRIHDYGEGSFQDAVIDSLNEILGYDFMSKDYIQEITEATKALIQISTPKGTQQQFQHGRMNFNLGDLRDFNDDLWFAAMHADEINWPQFDVVLADEVQDFNESQKIMLRKLAQAGAKIVAVGDPNQAIYRFRGADDESFNNISTMLGGLSHGSNSMFGLSKNFRSRKAIIDFANQESHVKNLQQGKQFDDGDGSVTKFEMKYGDAFQQLKAERAAGKIKQTAFISRTNEPLVQTALQLLGDKIPFVIVGKDVARDLKKHINKMGRFGLKDESSVNDLGNALHEFLEKETDKHSGSSTKKGMLQDLGNVTRALQACITQFITEQDQEGASQGYSYDRVRSNPSIKDFKGWLSKRLGGLDVQDNERDLATYKQKMEEESPVILTTAHKAKGLEFPRVYMLRYDMFPHPKSTRDKDLKQEENMRYVAITRAMDELHILNLEDQPGYKK